jgi:hypothetical protein
VPKYIVLWFILGTILSTVLTVAMVGKQRPEVTGPAASLTVLVCLARVAALLYVLMSIT